MRRIIGIISVFSAMEAFGILLSLGLGAQAAGGNSTDASCFTLSDGVITDYNAGDTKCGTDVVIPSTINGITIKEIGNNAFSDKGITSVSIPNSVEKIGSKAFSSNNIKNLVLPDSITTVGYAAFMGNKGLGKIKLSKNMEYIPADFCDGCDIKELEGGIPNGIKRIGTTAFYSRGSQEYEGGYTVWTNPTFRNMEKITIPESVTNIYGGGLGSTWFDTYEIYSNDITFDRVTTNYGQDVIFKLAKGAKVKYNLTNVPGFDTSRFGSKTYVSISNLEDDGVAVNFIIPREQAGTRVEFQPIGVGLKQGTKVSYPSDIELTGFTIEGWYRDIEFNEKFDINSETVDENLTLYGKLNPKPCWEFTVIDEENREVEVKKFNILYPHCQDEHNKSYENGGFTIPKFVPSDLEYAGYKVTGIGDMAFCDEVYRNGWGMRKESFVGKIIIPNTIKYIGRESFRKSGLEYLVLPDSIESIGDAAFFDNNRLTGVKWSENLESIGSNAFAYNGRLKTGNFPDSLKYIGYAAFHESGISEIKFGSGSQLQTIGGLAFAYTDDYNGPQYGNVKEITFPRSLKSIDGRAFYNNRIEEVTLLSDSCTIYQNAFQVPARNDKQIPGYKRRNADIKNYDSHLLLTDIVETYKITLDSDGATEKGTENLWYDLGTPIYYLDKEKQNTIDGGITIPTKEGYSFQGYFTEKNGNGLKYISNLGVIGKIYNIDSDTVLYASWKKDEEQDNTHNAASSDCNGLAEPKREGYKFIGWYTDKNYTKLYNPNELVTGELTLYSKWEKEGGNSGTGTNNNQGDDSDDDSDDDHGSEILVEKITVSFETNGGSKIEKLSIKSGSIPRMPESPVKDGFIFVNWFTDTNLTRQYNFDTALSSDITLYAKWEKIPKEEYGETNANVPGTVVYNGVNMDTITVSYGNESITILDRNLGATKAGTGRDSYGYYFQWGNNHGFTEKDNITHTYNDHTYKGYGPVDPLDSDLFGGTYFDIWENSKHFDFIWGGEKDNGSNNYNAGNVKLIENHTSRQGPCPEGFHIPSAGEWSKLIELWGNKNGVYNWKSDEYNLKEISNQKGIGEKLSNDLLIPFAGTISVGSWGSVSMSHVGEMGSLWTSSPFITEDGEDSRKNLSRSMYIYNDGLTLSIDNRSEAQNIRCFKDTKLKTISNYSIFFDTNGGKHINNMTFTPYSNSVTVGHPMEEANGRYVLDLYDIEKYLVPIRTGYEFIGWYSDKGLTNKFDFDTILTNNIVLYAKRSKSISHDTVNGIDTITVYDYSSDKSITIMANNLGVTSNQQIGYLYQWGNNYGFTEKQLETRTTTPIKYENYGPQKPYKSGKYVVSSPNNYYDYWENDAHYPNLRGGEGDTQSNNWNASTEKSLRQGPCPEGFHVPSKGEWDDLINIWSKNNGITWTMSMYGGYPDKPAYNKIVKDLNLWSGYYYRTLWSSSPIEAGKAYYLGIVNDYTISAKYAMSNNSVAQIRCFLNDSIEKDEDNNSNDENNIKNSVIYSVKHFTETLTGDYKLHSTETLKAESGSQVTPPVKNFNGYIAPSKKTITVKGDGSSVVEYQYGRTKYKVTVEKGAGVSAVKGYGEYKYGQNVSIRATPLAGYKITGFDGDVKTGSFTMPAKNVKVIVKAEKDNTKYKISYDYNGGKLESGKVNPINYTTDSQSFNLNPPVKDGFIFAGWQETINGKLVGTKTYVSIPKGSSGNRSYKAMWKKEGEVEEVIYNQQEDLNGEYNTVEVILVDNNGGDGNNGGGNGSSSTPRSYVGFITPTDFSKQTDSSNVNQGAVGEVLNLSDGVAVIIYKYKRDSFRLTINKDEGIESVEGAGTYKYQQPVSIKVKVKSGYTFAGFEGEINVSDFEMPAKNLVIKATSTKK